MRKSSASNSKIDRGINEPNISFLVDEFWNQKHLNNIKYDSISLKRKKVSENFKRKFEEIEEKLIMKTHEIVNQNRKELGQFLKQEFEE